LFGGAKPTETPVAMGLFLAGFCQPFDRFSG